MTTALHRLRDPAHPALDELVGLVADMVVERPLAELVDLEAAVGLLHAAASRLSADPARRAAVVARVDAARAALRAERRAVGAFVPPDLASRADHALRLPWSPSQELVLAVIRHDAVRGLLREVLSGTVTRFAQRLRTAEAGVLGGLGGAARAGRGLFGSVAASLGAAAEGIAGGLQKELEAVLQGRVESFVEGAIDEALRTIAAWVADPRQQAPSAALRASILQVVLDRPVGELAAELDELGSAELVDALLDGLTGGPLPEALVELAATQTLAPWLDAAGAREAFRDAVAATLRPGLRTLVEQESFAAWWSRLSS